VVSGEGEKVGADFGWHDVTTEINVRGAGANNPTWAQIGAGVFYGYNFAVGDECWMTFHVPHDIVPSSDIYLHTHWLPNGTDANDVKWTWTYTYAKGFDQAAFSSTGTAISATGAINATPVAYQHYITETAAITIAGLTEPDGLIYVHLTRVTNGAVDNTDGIFLLTADMHYQSTGVATKNKAPNFYT
jgi:hypothetical protein